VPIHRNSRCPRLCILNHVCSEMFHEIIRIWYSSIPDVIHGHVIFHIWTFGKGKAKDANVMICVGWKPSILKWWLGAEKANALWNNIRSQQQCSVCHKEPSYFPRENHIVMKYLALSHICRILYSGYGNRLHWPLNQTWTLFYSWWILDPLYNIRHM
jgi:hypothetical protein